MTPPKSLLTLAGLWLVSVVASAAPVQTPPTVDFNASTTSGNAPLTVSFQPDVTNATSGSWDFGDGGTANTRLPSHTYTTPGLYTVSLTVNGPGGSATETKVDFIQVNAPTGFMVDFSAVPTTGPAPLAVQFASSGTGGATGGGWDFGDGGTAGVRNPLYVYNTPGTYTVTLSAFNATDSDSETKVGYITVTPPDQVNIDFVADAFAGDEPFTVNFSAIGAQNATSGTWDFGDGTTANSVNPTHTYTEPGIYEVSLTASNAVSTDTETKSNYIHVVELSDDPFPLTQANGVAGINPFTMGNGHTGGAAWVDYNGDMLPDLFVTNGAGLDHYLYRNEGDGSFADVSFLVAKPDIGVEDGGVLFGDIDNDGDDDILVYADSEQDVNPSGTNAPEGGPNQFYLNNGDGTFTEMAASMGDLVDDRGWRNITGGFADYDADGFLDVYLATWSLGSPSVGVYNKFDRMLRNNGDGTFGDTTGLTGTDDYGRNTLVCLWMDPNFDGLPDLYVGNVHGAGPPMPPVTSCTDVYYQNNGDGSFTDVRSSSAVGVGDDACAAMGMDIADIDGDGDWDFYITDQFFLLPEPLGNPLYLGNPDGTFEANSADVAGVEANDSWPCNFADFDRDGWVDLWVGSADRPVKDPLYLNNGDGTFRVATATASGGYRTRGGSVADYDGDGDVDIFMHNQGDASMLYRNDSTDTNNWMSFHLTGTTSNTTAIGAVVRVTAGGLTQMRRVSGGDSAHSQRSNILSFGLGTETSADVSVTWPSGAVQNFMAVATGDLVLINEDSGIEAESLLDSSVKFDQVAGQLFISAKSSYGGRSNLSVKGLGELTYNAAKTRFEGSFEMTQRLDSVTLESERGARWSLDTK